MSSPVDRALDIETREQPQTWTADERRAYRLTVAERVRQITGYARPTANQLAQLAAYQAELRVLDELGRADVRAAVTTGGGGYAVRNTSGVTITSLGANGAAPTYDALLDAVQSIRSGKLRADRVHRGTKNGNQVFETERSVVGRVSGAAGTAVGVPPAHYQPNSHESDRGHQHRHIRDLRG